MSKIAFLGPKALVLPLGASGLETFACETTAQAKKTFSTLVEKEDFAIIFITERLAAEMLEEIELAEEKDINIMVLPDHRGSTGLFKERIEKLIKKATGALRV
ncbi:MAG: V-type ATP synthase subunit F [Candidatus Margulisiibacteriota bacterium]